MADIRELNSFVTKFKNLWKAGCNASLKVETRAGEAWVELHVGLGVPHPVQGGHELHGNARQRRKDKRTAARAAAHEAKIAEEANAAEQVNEVLNSSVEEVHDEANKVKETKNATVQVTISSQVSDEFEEETSPKVDGIEDKKEVVFTFLSDYGEEDILDSFPEIFPRITAKLASRVRVTPRSADHLCTVVLHPVHPKTFSWPAMDPVNTEVFRDITRIQK